MNARRSGFGTAAPGVRFCLVLAALGAAAGLALRLAVPVEPPEPTFLARVEQWRTLAPELERERRMPHDAERATRRP